MLILYTKTWYAKKKFLHNWEHSNGTRKKIKVKVLDSCTPNYF